MYVSETQFSARPLWLWPNLLSLDAPLIAVLWLHLFALCAHVRLEPAATVALALVVWLIYVADRLLDGWRAQPDEVISPRHRFYRIYRTHRNGFTALLAAVVVIACGACLDLDARTFEAGVVLAAIVGAYFAAVHWLGIGFPKEAAVAVLFGVGSVFPAWVEARQGITEVLLPGVLLVLICWLNAALIEYAEWVHLRGRVSDTPHPSTITAGKHVTGVSCAVGVSSICLALAGGFRLANPVMFAIALSAIGLAVLGLYWRRLSANSVRVLADAALLSPAIILLVWNR